ncbi:inner centromere protein A-like isoform X2 [Gigantopelta aegis]|uniref:inner centromere protein A-like isoform X2 n=1 Tax=Gigantopelta aegis TaxID=1735272 RepID=UPI001B88D486|nr:inner centromere protein A-like isoform X2 [Gigantopelta aegis]
MVLAYGLPPMKVVKLPNIFSKSYSKKVRGSHCYRLRHRWDDRLRLRRLGSGLVAPVVVDSAILADLLSLLDSHRSGASALEADFPEIDNVSHSSDYGGSFKGCTIPRHEKTRHKSASRSWTYEGSEKEYIGSAPVVTIREGASPILSSNIPHLPPLKTARVPLTPIQDVSREQTHLPLPPIADGLPFVNIEGPTPQHTTLTDVPRPIPSELPADVEETGSQWGVSSTHSDRDRGVRHVSTQWKGSQQSLKSSKKGTRSIIGDQSIKGSVVRAPDGEIVSVGGSILPDAASQHGGSQTARTDLDRGIGATDESDISDNEPDAWKSGSREDVFRVPSEQKSTSTKEASRKESAGSEQVIVDTLTGHAQIIAARVLNRAEAGRDLEADIRQAAELWTKEHPPRSVSRSQSVQEIVNTEAVDEIARQRANSAAPTAQEYKDLIRQSLTTAVAMAAGKEPDAFPFDAEVSPELLDALASQSLSPDDIEIVTDADGRNVIRSKSRMLQEMGGVKEGHIYMSATSGPPSERSAKRTISIPSDRISVADVGEYDVINYANEAVSERSRSSQHRSVSTSPEPDDFTTALQKAETDSKKSTSSTSRRVALDDTVKSNKTDVSKKSEDSKVSVDSKSKAKKKTILDREEFVVGKPKAPKPKKEPVPPKKEEKKKGPAKKKGKKAKKEEPVAAPKPATPPPKPATPPPPSPPKVPTPPKTATPDEFLSPISSPEKSDDDMEFIIIRDESPSPEPVLPEKPSPIREPSPKSEPMSEPQSEDDDMALKSISSKEARAAKREAAAKKRREEVERRRKEREEQQRREKEEQERQERLRREMEEERRRLEEERRLRRQRLQEERNKEEEAEKERERRKLLELEKEKRQKEEFARKLEEMKRRQAEEDLKRQELQRQRELEEEERRKEEELRMSLMAEQERLEYERMKKEEEEQRRIKEEEDRKRREEEAQRALEEARRLAEDMARRQAELEQRLKFNRDLQLEAGGLEHTQDITRMFVFSYFELLQWLGLDIPEFELQKLNNL